MKFNEAGCRLGVLGFYAAPHKVEQCGNNGLPLTPNSVRIYGQAQELKKLRHESLCQFIDVVIGEQERVYWVVEHHTTSAALLVSEGRVPSPSTIFGIALDILKGLEYLHDRGIVSRNVSLDTILISAEGRAKLSNYGLYFASESGASVGFPIGDAMYMSPELIGRGPYSEVKSTQKEDIWALGVVQVELAMGGNLWGQSRSTGTTHIEPLPILQRILEYHQTEAPMAENQMNAQSALRRIQSFTGSSTANLHGFPEAHLESIGCCLNPTAKFRPSSTELLSHPAFPGEVVSKDMSYFWLNVRSTRLGSPIADLDLGELNLTDRTELRKSVATTKNRGNKTISGSICNDPLEAWNLEDVYYLWSLLDIGLEAEFIRKGYVKKPPSVFRIARLIRGSTEEIRPQADQSMLFNPTTYMLDTSALSKRLKEANLDLFPSVIPLDGEQKLRPPSAKVLQTQELPLLIRERDLDYQHYRLQLMHRLLRGFPFTSSFLHTEARVDVPRPLRSQLWAAMLDVPTNIGDIYNAIDKEAPGPTDHQLAVDIPRCHQYDPLLSSPQGHHKFRRILKAWIVTNPKFVYWQGLDSVCAPFLVSSFADEAMAYGCLHSFVNRYLQNFFLKDNSMVMQEYLAIFIHMICYHDPELGFHLHSIGFIPELYAIPWFLTCFAHVFPLDKIMHIWDSLMLCGPSMAICIGVAILKDIRDVLLSFSFEQCILLFSDAPDVDVESIIIEAHSIFKGTKPSMCARQYSGTAKEHTGSYKVPEILVLKSQISPCISINDFMELVMLGSGDRNGNGLGPALSIDIRSESEYVAGCLESDNINVPFKMALDEMGNLRNEYLNQVLAYEGKPIVVVDKRGKEAPQFAEALVKACIPKVCILNGGASTLRMQGLLSTAGPPGLPASVPHTATDAAPITAEKTPRVEQDSIYGGSYYDDI